MRYSVFRLAIAAVAVLAGALGAASPAAAEAALQVSQSAGLRDGQTVTVTLTGLPANLTSVAVAQCKSTVTSPMDCNLPGALMGNADANGVWQPNGDKRSIAVLSSIGVTDCMAAAGACAISVTSLSNPAAIIASTPLTFGGPAEQPKPDAAAQSSTVEDDADHTPLIVGGIVAVLVIAVAAGAAVLLRRRGRR
ncbi:neocarzinostatin apoprotein domain-containing protein [Nocardia sp. NPDC051321]|uniref:neocarzinostatin apoprotein domain-containing protein n=1 Tax=Nocardia sp. NPDC051321 TaxID=3364323 RepID=UPI0037948A6B